MRVIANTSGAVEAEQRLVATMVNIEHGALVVDDRGEPLGAGPPQPYPTLRVEPLTAGGLPLVYRLKPAVGVVFYTAGAGFQIGPFVHRVQAALARHGYGHLLAHRATSASPCVTVRTHRSPPALDEVTSVVGPRKPYGRGGGDRPEQQPDRQPARLLLYTPAHCEELPDQVSHRAGFTWVFTSIGAIAGLARVEGPAALNALMASVLYDDAGLVRLANNSTVHLLPAAAVALPALPAAIRGLDPKALASLGVLGPTAQAPRLGGARAVFVITRRGTGVASHRSLELSYAIPGPLTGVTYLARNVTWESLRPSCAERAKAPGEGASSSGAEAAGAGLKCPLCTTPLWGDVFALDNPLMPAPPVAGANPPNPPLDGSWGAPLAYDVVGPGEPVLEGRALVICRFCARNLCPKVGAHLSCAIYRSRVGRTHDEAFAGHALEPLLAITRAAAEGLAPVPDMPGYFLVGAGEKAFVLAPAGTSQWETTAVASLSSRAVLRATHIVELA